MSSDAYTVKFTVGNVGEPGAPILHVTAVVNDLTDKINGHGVITQAIEGSAGHIELHHLTGQLTMDKFRNLHRTVTLQGSFVIPPTEVVQGFSAELELAVDAWTGSGTFTYGAKTASGPVAPVQAAVAV